MRAGFRRAARWPVALAWLVAGWCLGSDGLLAQLYVHPAAALLALAITYDVWWEELEDWVR